MSFESLAAIHAGAFPGERGWSAREIEDLATSKGGVLVTHASGFALGRNIAGEVELLTIAVLPEAQGQGVGRDLLAAFEAQSGTAVAFLEVAEDNTPARALYERAGWRETGRRKGYYTRGPDRAVDAILMTKTLPGDFF
ncbi:GNAT family N-acetyltransferase [Maritimibacter sp. DP1N21-5]|uniref:GNAT family N-acetyltransferase n=1 Tax=Maritimibacter sp. DP1N21-5 TaxID=2836867 RepID=UPI001C465CFE|nr:GNAT family N-acetyltransferase [Maritimibacter sp. DP1N21-5]